VGLETPQEPHGLLAGVRSLGGGGGDGGRVGTAQGTWLWSRRGPQIQGCNLEGLHSWTLDELVSNLRDPGMTSDLVYSPGSHLGDWPLVESSLGLEKEGGWWGHQALLQPQPPPHTSL
jgi:hypothetical protein